jgi:hypothetical protein
MHIFEPIDDIYHMSKMCITGHEIYNGQRQNVSGHLRAHLGWANGQPGKKNTLLIYVTSSQNQLWPLFCVQCIFLSVMFD